MLRFLPDSLGEGLLRPLLLADPEAGLYVETHAPDWRFALLLLFFVLAAAGKARARSSPMFTPVQWRLFAAVGLSFYLWTFVSGNGRYFMWALLLVGPLVVVVARRLPASRAMRNFAILGALTMQIVAVWMTFEVNAWGLRPWRSGPGLTIAKTPLQDRPAVFLSIGWISYSILVPQMHPEARWANITGQRDLVPGMRDYERLQELLRSPLPKYVLFNAARIARADNDQPVAAAGEAIRHILRQQRLRPTADACEFVSAAIGGVPHNTRTSEPVDDGFWFCAVEPDARATDAAQPAPVAPELNDVFERVEDYCPRYFPRGSAHTRLHTDGVVVRHYTRSDTTVYVNPAGDVYLKYFRALNPTVVGEVATVRRNEFAFDCERIDGRYRPPWDRH